MKETLKKLLTSFKYSLIIVLLLWIVIIIENILHTHFYQLGIYPRSTEGLLGILTSPLIHADFSHLIANTAPMLIFTTLLFFLYEQRGYSIFILLWFTAGVFTWIIGRSSWHIGASSVIYAEASFLVFAGFFSKSLKLIFISLIIVVLYSGLIFGLLPINSQVSWEGHLSGAVAGLMWAYIFRNKIMKDKMRDLNIQ